MRISNGFRGKMAAMALVCALALAGCKSDVYQGLTEQQANTMMSLLLKHGIASEKEATKNGFKLRVDSDRIVQTLELMRENNLPRQDYRNMGEVFAAKGMISSSTEEQARMAYALSQELSDTFSNIDGVLTARVHVVLGSQDLATGRITPPSAAVFLRHTPSSQASHLISRIRELTSNAIPGLSQEHVSVMLVPVRESVTVPMGNAAGASQLERHLMLGSAILFILSLIGLIGSATLWWKGRAQQERKDSQD